MVSVLSCCDSLDRIRQYPAVIAEARVFFGSQPGGGKAVRSTRDIWQNNVRMAGKSRISQRKLLLQGCDQRLYRKDFVDPVGIAAGKGEAVFKFSFFGGRKG